MCGKMQEDTGQKFCHRQEERQSSRASILGLSQAASNVAVFVGLCTRSFSEGMRVCLCVCVCKRGERKEVRKEDWEIH